MEGGADSGLFGSIMAFFSQEWVKSLLIAAAVALVIRWIVAEPFRIPSGSMEPTLHGDPALFKGDRVFVDKLAYGTRFPCNRILLPFSSTWLDYANRRIWYNEAPKRFDLVVFKSVEDDARFATLVKRIVGMPGERIHIEDGKVFVNGTPLELSPDMPDIYYTSPPEAAYGILEDDAHSVVPEGCYLLLGDNSDHSRDGRYFGWVPNEHLLGRVASIWWPPSRWRDFTGFSHKWPWCIFLFLLSLLTVVRLFFGRSYHLAHRDDANRIRFDHYFINRMAYGFPIPFFTKRLVQWGAPQRGELVLYRNPNRQSDQPKLLMGRIAAMPGERVYLDAGRLTVNGEAVEQPLALTTRSYPPADDMGPYGRSKGKEFSMIPDNHYFILMESTMPEEHLDSRTVGWVSRDLLIGKALFVWWPIRRWRRIH